MKHANSDLTYPAKMMSSHPLVHALPSYRKTAIKKSITLCALFILFCLTSSPLFAQDQGSYWTRWESAVKANNWMQAERVMREGLLRFPDDVNFAASLSNALGKQSRAAEAVAFIELLFAKRPAEPRLREALVHSLLAVGWKHYELGARAAALAPFVRAYTLLPEDRNVMNAYGCVLRDTGRVDEAIPILEKGYRIWPDDKYLKPNLAEAYVIKANLLAKGSTQAANQAAESFFAKMAALDATTESYLMNYGTYFNEKRRYSEALVLFEEGLRRYPANKWVRTNIQYALQEQSRALAATGDLVAALQAAEAAAARFPREIWLITDCYEWSDKLKRFDRAEYWLKILALEPALRDYGKPFSLSREEQVVHRLNAMWWNYAQRREYSRGFALINAVARGFPGALFIEEARGHMLFHSGRKDEGVAAVNRVYNRYIRDNAQYAVPLVLDLPMRGTILVWGNNRTESITHAGMNRFCFDFLGADEMGEVRKPGTENPGRNQDYWGFGRDVLSAADGVVESVVDGYGDLEPRLIPQLDDGNCVNVKDARGFHYSYVHIRKGSATVKSGQVVKAGQKLAELGNSGYTLIPHLHFAVHSPDWRVTIPVRFTSYRAKKKAGAWVDIEKGVPVTGDVISR